MGNDMSHGIDRLHNVKHLLGALLIRVTVNPSLMEHSDPEEMKKRMVDFLGSLIQIMTELGIDQDEVFQLSQENIGKKRILERFEEYGEVIAEFLSMGFKVVRGEPWEMLQQLSEIVAHAEGLWSDAVALFEQQRFATACFLAIACIEECAKISFGEVQLHDIVLQSAPLSDKASRGKSPLRSHVKKHFLAACSGALVNTRMDERLGVDNVNSFIEDCEGGKLEGLRQRCLYADTSQKGIALVPASQITKEQSFFYTCLAGELLAEVQGAGTTRRGFLERLNKFEAENE